MNSVEFKSDLRLELKTRLLPLLLNDFVEYHVKTQHRFFLLETPVFGWEDEWRDFPAKDLLLQSSNSDQTQKVTVLSGNPGTGKTTLARSILLSWLKSNKEFSELQQYEGVFIIDGEILDKEESLTAIRTILPNILSKWGLDILCQWIETAKILLIIDDFLMDTDEEANLLMLLKEWKGSDFLILAGCDDGPRIFELIEDQKPHFYCRFKALDHTSRVTFVNYFLEQKIKGQILTEGVDLNCKKLEPLLSTMGGMTMYLSVITKFPQILFSKHSVTGFLWDTIYCKMKEIKSKIMLQDEYINLCLSELGKLCYDNLAAKAPFIGEEVLPFLEYSRNILHDDRIGSLILNELLSKNHNFQNKSITYSICHVIQQFVLAAFYVLKKNMDGTPLKRMFKKIKYDDELAICIAGLLSSFMYEESKTFNYFDKEPEKKGKKVERVIKNLVLHTDRSSDPIAFTMRVINELQYNKNLVSLYLQDSVFPNYLHIHDVGIYSGAIKEVCNLTSPLKIHLLIRRGLKPPELTETLDLIKDLNCELALAEMNHVSWNSLNKSDELMSILFEGSAIRLKDFIGCLEEKSIRELPLNEVSKYLVCLRLRVCDAQTTEILGNVQRELKQLMWMEIDFDFNLSEVFELDLSSIKTPLIDLSFKNVSDADVGRLCNFLYSISRQFSGLHIHQSNVSPQGVTEILKYCYKRDLRLNADPETVTKYRKYRFPELKNTELKELTNEEVERLIGYDDRRHYSDNEVRSSYSSTFQEVSSLKNFFDIMNLVYFIYSCSNYCVVKEINGNSLLKKNLIA